jgi:hypothetical protein
MARPEAPRLLCIARRDLRMARRLLDPQVEEASWGWAAQQCLCAFIAERMGISNLQQRARAFRDGRRSSSRMPGRPTLLRLAVLNRGSR